MEFSIGFTIGIVVAAITMVMQWTVLPVDGRGLLEILGGLAAVSLVLGLRSEVACHYRLQSSRDSE
mgnify:CR=1 FL=1